MSKEHEELELAILNILSERGRISITDLATDLDSTSQAVQIPLGHLKEDDKVTISGDDVMLKMSAKERKDFERLDRKFERGQRDSIAALREIRDRKLFREDFRNFDDYMASRGKSRQWATQQTNWLRRIELLEENGKDSYQLQLTVDDVQVLGPLECDPEAFMRAVVEGVEEAERQGMKQKKPFLKEAVARQKRYFARREEMPDLTYQEGRILDQLNERRSPDPNLVDEAQAESAASGNPLPDCLLAICDRDGTLPTDEQLLSAARGDELVALVEPLTGLAKKWREDETLRKKQESLQEQLASVERKLAAPKEAQSTGGDTDTAEVAKVEEADKERQQADGPLYVVELTGTFHDWAKMRFHDIDGGVFPQHGVAELVNYIADSMARGFPVEEESSIVVTPYEDEEAAEENDTEE